MEADEWGENLPRVILLRKRRPAWWAWPLILLALIPLDVLWEPFTGNAETDQKSESIQDERASLLLLKLQSQVLIATGQLDESLTREHLESLAENAKGENEVAAIVLLENFLLPSLDHSPAIEKWIREHPRGFAADVAESVKQGISAKMRAEWAKKLGWFVDLAPDAVLSSSLRTTEIRLRAVMITGMMGLLFFAVCAGVLTGCILLVIHRRFLRSGRRRNSFVPSQEFSGILLESFSLYLLFMTLGPVFSIWIGFWGTVAGFLASVFIPILWASWRGLRWREFRVLTGLNRGQGVWREVLAGGIGYLGVMAIATIGIGMTLLLSWVGESAVQGFHHIVGGEASGEPPGPEIHPIVGWLYDSNFWMKSVLLLLAAGYAPLVEETFFRGALQGYFRSRFSFLPAALLTGLIFAALHPQGFYAIPALAAIGFGLSLLREWRDSLIASMTAHAINNGILVVILWSFA